MAFHQISAPHGQRSDKVLSADNVIPERHVVIDIIRKAAPVLGLKAPVIATLDAMLSCLAPKRNHHMVFASNATLCFRRNGISDRTIRRHVAALEQAGLLQRRDSPNRKRFSRRSALQGMALRFGFDLAPLYARLDELAAHAEAQAVRAQEIAYMRCQIRATLNAILTHTPEDQEALETLKLLRRKLTLEQLGALLETLPETANVSPIKDQPDAPVTKPLSANNGQSVRHHKSLKKEPIVKKKTGAEKKDISVSDIVTACPEASHYALTPIRSIRDVITHARTLAPMLGISPVSYEQAEASIGSVKTAVTIWGVVQMKDKIKTISGYFKSLTSGKHSSEFDPFALIRRLGIEQDQLRAIP